MDLNGQEVAALHSEIREGLSEEMTFEMRPDLNKDVSHQQSGIRVLLTREKTARTKALRQEQAW